MITGGTTKQILANKHLKSNRQDEDNKTKMVASAVFITDLSGKAIISRNYRGDVPLTKAIDRFATYLEDVDDDAKKPIFHVDVNGDVQVDEDVGASGVGGEHFVYIAVSKKSNAHGHGMARAGQRDGW